MSEEFGFGRSVFDVAENRRLKIAALEAENARLKEAVESSIQTIEESNSALRAGIVQIETKSGDLDAARAALRRAYRKSEVLDEPGYVLDYMGDTVKEGDPDFDTITKAFEAGE